MIPNCLYPFAHILRAKLKPCFSNALVEVIVASCIMKNMSCVSDLYWRYKSSLRNKILNTRNVLKILHFFLSPTLVLLTKLTTYLQQNRLWSQLGVYSYCSTHFCTSYSSHESCASANGLASKSPEKGKGLFNVYVLYTNC